MMTRSGASGYGLSPLDMQCPELGILRLSAGQTALLAGPWLGLVDGEHLPIVGTFV
jgi:hypothetical protein